MQHLGGTALQRQHTHLRQQVGLGVYLDVSLLQAGHICDKVVRIAHIFNIDWQNDSAGEVSSSLRKCTLLDKHPRQYDCQIG